MINFIFSGSADCVRVDNFSSRTGTLAVCRLSVRAPDISAIVLSNVPPRVAASLIAASSGFAPTDNSILASLLCVPSIIVKRLAKSWASPLVN